MLSGGVDVRALVATCLAAAALDAAHAVLQTPGLAVIPLSLNYYLLALPLAAARLSSPLLSSPLLSSPLASLCPLYRLSK